MRSAIRDDTFREAMEFSDVIEEESGCSFCCDRRVRRNEVYSFGASIHNHHDSVMSRRLQEFNHKIDTERIPPCIQNRKQLKLADWRVSLRFCPETEITGTYILADIPRHLRPPVVPGH